MHGWNIDENHAIIDSMVFKLKVAEGLIEGECNTLTDKDSDTDSNSTRKRPIQFPSTKECTQESSHMPEVLPAYSVRQRCR